MIQIEWAAPAEAAVAAAFADLGARCAPFVDHDPVAGAVAIGIADAGDGPRARASLWLADDLACAPGRSGLVGHYASVDGDAGVELLVAAAARLRALGAVRVLGPMNGGTWRRYRLELPREAGDPNLQPDGFASEPRNPPRYVAEFAAAGLAVVARYESRYVHAPRIDATALARAHARAAAVGIAVHAITPPAFDATLRAMHALSLDAFGDNAYYAPLPLADFVAQYAPYRDRLEPALVRLATRRDGTLAGYMFGFPDPLSAPGARPMRSIAKTLAVAHDARGHGLASLLFDDFHAASNALGYGGVVHALIRSDNVSLRMSESRGSTVFKRYALFGDGA